MESSIKVLLIVWDNEHYQAFVNTIDEAAVELFRFYEENGIGSEHCAHIMKVKLNNVEETKELLSYIQGDEEQFYLLSKENKRGEAPHYDVKVKFYPVVVGQKCKLISNGFFN